MTKAEKLDAQISILNDLLERCIRRFEREAVIDEIERTLDGLRAERKALKKELAHVG